MATANLHPFKSVVTLGSRPNAASTSTDSVTPLHTAANKGSFWTVKELVDEGANIEADSIKFGTPLMAAAVTGKTDVVDFLIKKGAKGNAISRKCEHRTALLAAACVPGESGRNTVDTLLKNGADVNLAGGEYGSALCTALWHNESSAIRILDKNPDINNAEGCRGTALEICLQMPRDKAHELILKRHPDLNVVSKGCFGTALIAAVYNRGFATMKELLENNADPNVSHPENKWRPAQIAIQEGKEDVLELLVQKGANLSYRDAEGRSALSDAILYRSDKILPWLLTQKGVALDAQDDLRDTALMVATAQYCPEHIFDCILEAGARVNVQNRWGFTPLIMTVIGGSLAFVSKLLAKGADPFLKDLRGRDALYWATLALDNQNPHVSSSFDSGWMRKEIFELVFTDVIQAYYKYPRGRGLASIGNARHAAVIARNEESMDRFFVAYKMSEYEGNEDGWSFAFTAIMSGYFLSDPQRHILSLSEPGPPEDMTYSYRKKYPSQWHSKDIFLGFERLSQSSLTIKYCYQKWSTCHGIARADHPIVPAEDGVFYFEIALSIPGFTPADITVGLCHENASCYFKDQRVSKIWGYNGWSGCKMTPGQDTSFSSREAFGPKFGDQDTIGCGINFQTHTVFYTHNGRVVGCAFENIMGKLYPAVSANMHLVGCVLTAKFRSNSGKGKDDFLYKGSFTSPETLSEAARMARDRGKLK